jgi:hypothetical protein
MVFALVGGDDGRMQLRVRGRAPKGQRNWASFLRQQIEGRAPGTTARPAPDDLAEALDAAQPGQVLAWADLLLQRDASYPLNDLSQFATDPMGPLAAALRGSRHCHYSAYEIIVRAVENRWRRPVRTQVAQIQATLTPDDLPGHDALLTKAAQAAYDVVVRCIVIADDVTSARAQLTDMREMLAQFDRPTRGATQRLLIPSVDRLAPGGARGRVVTIPPRRAPREPSSRRNDVWLLGVALLGGALGTVLASGVLLRHWPLLGTQLARLPQLGLLPHALPHPPFLPPGAPIVLPALPMAGRVLLGALLGALASGCAVLASRPERAHERARQAIAQIRAHAHRFAWPGPSWPIPLPGKRRSVMGAFDLAALWHIPDASMDALVAYRGVRYLPKPRSVFLDDAEAEAAEQRQVLPPPRNPLELARRRIALAAADRPDGSVGLIGPTVRDLRKGSECLGPMGSGKSCYIETLAVELARVGSGFGLIDAKGDLADRLLSALPREAHERVVVIDVSSGVVPCINPMDARLLRAGMPLETLAGQVEQLFARIDPEMWHTSMGMQQFCRNGLYALLEGEATPSLMHQNVLYGSRAYREAVLQGVRNPQILNFWNVEYPAMDDTLRRSIESFRRRLQRFITAPLIQQLFCQPESTIYLPELMDRRGILIVKLVPEVISDEMARIIATTLLASLSAATFTRQQRESDPELRWDWPLIIDEVQKFIDTEHVGDTETFLTQTRSLGVGLHGAHQGLYQLGDAVQAAVLQSLGGLAVLGPVKQDARALVEAYAETGLREADFAAVRAQQELLLRFPIHDRDSGLLTATPRRRPPANPPTPTLRARLLADAKHAPFRAIRASAIDLQARRDDVLLERLWSDAEQHGPSSVATNLLHVVAKHGQPDLIAAMVERLRARSAAHHQAQADALQADGRQLPDAALTLRELSALRYGVDPVISACYARALDHRYPIDPIDLTRRRRGREPVRTSETTVPSTTQNSTNGGAAPSTSSFAWDGTAQPQPND